MASRAWKAAEKGAWKAAEKAAARVLNGKRIGVTGINTNDVVTDKLAVEVKHTMYPPVFVTKALEQARRNRQGDRVPVAVIHPKGSAHYLAVLTLHDLATLIADAEAQAVTGLLTRLAQESDAAACENGGR